MPHWLSFAIFIVTVAVSFAFGFVAQNNYGRFAAWLIVVGGVIVVVAALAKKDAAVRSIFVDQRNRYSQPALITIAWFVVIVSAYLACALWNVALWIPSQSTSLPVEIDVPASIWVLAGIVGADVLAAGVILWQKQQRPRTTHQAKVATELCQSVEAGTLFVRVKASDAEAVDFVAYDEPGVQNDVDLAALQKLLFQIAAVIVYAVALGRLIFSMPANDVIAGFPPIPEGFLALLGVSTATAAANRSIPR